MDETLFPYEEKREVQDQFLQDVVRHLNNGKNFLVHAPTGLGKTTILGPALFYALNNKKTTIIDNAKNTLTGTSFGSFLILIIDILLHTL